MQNSKSSENIDEKTVEGFGEEWSAYDQTEVSEAELGRHFQQYFSVFPFHDLPPNAEGFDLGCGSGRWAAFLAPRIGTLHCIDPSQKALDVAQRRLSGLSNVRLHLAASESMPMPDDSQDFGYSLGVLHHIPNTESALRDCVRKLKAGAPFLLYLYYNFDNRPIWFRWVWQITDPARRVIARTPFPVRNTIATVIAALIYWPMARIAKMAERAGAEVGNIPLSAYRQSSIYTMRTDALDRFGTRLEQRFSRRAIESMMKLAGLQSITFREDSPFWVACGRRSR